MIKKKGIVRIYDNDDADFKELNDSVAGLPPGEYGFLIYDNSKNRSLPQIKYLFSTVLKTISEKLDSHPSPEALYRYFEELYAPIHVSYVEGEKFEYFDLKNEKTVELDSVVEKIVQHAMTEWNISVPSREEMREKQARELYAEAYAGTWKFLSQN